jgi:hypothetical protein
VAGAPAYSAVGFQRFLDRVMMHGLEWLGLYYGPYRALVVGNSGFSEGGAVAGVVGGAPDMDRMGLLKVRVPGIGDTEKTPARTAYPKEPMAGANYGVKSLPPVGGYVWVEFERGRPDMPIWSGGWWAKGEMPSELESVDAHGWVTPGGHKFLLVDDAGKQKVRLEHSTGAYLEWDLLGNLVLTNFETVPGATTIKIGEEASEAAILGDTLKGLLNELLDAISKMTMISPAGTTSPPVNVAEFKAIQARLETILSLTVKVK